MRRAGPIATVLASLLLAAGARAQPRQSVDGPSARELFERGVGHAEAGEWEPALEDFRASLALVERPRTLFNVAVALDHLERGPECVAAIDALLDHEDVDPRDREEAERLRRRWRARLGRLVLRLEPAGARASVDGDPLEGMEALLAPGTHRLRVEAPGHRPLERDVEIAAGGERRLELALEAVGGLGLRGVVLRPLDRATVRIVGLRGADVVQPRVRGGVSTVVPRAAHGSGLAVDPAGWIVTARHVVEGADRLIVLLPGETRALAAEAAWLDPERDLAIVRVSEPLAHVLPLAVPPALELGAAVDASGYPLDPTERWPNASSGQIGRPLNDGRVQLSIALNPGNSGGPVAVDGAPIGVVSQGGDPGAGVQGVTVMEPIGPVREALAGLRASPGGPPEVAGVDALLAELIGAAEPPPTVRRLARLREASSRVASDVRAAVWALEADAIRRTLLRAAGVGSPSGLPPTQAEQHAEATRLGAALSNGVLREAGLAERYAALRALSVDVRRPEWTALGPTEPEPPGRGRMFDVTLAGGLAVDDHQRSSFVEGAMFSAMGLFRIGNFGRLDPVRFNVIAGAEIGLGSWRESFVFDLLADVGVRFAVGEPNLSVALQLMYTPGPVLAEQRWGFTYLAYRATISLQLGHFGVGLSWRELSRGAEDTQRSLELLLSWGIG